MDSWAFDEKHYFYIMCFLFFVSLPLFASEMVLSYQGPVYTKRQRQRCEHTGMTLQNGVATHFQASPLISMRAESQASSQSGRSVDTDTWCKRALTLKTGSHLTFTFAFAFQEHVKFLFSSAQADNRYENYHL